MDQEIVNTLTKQIKELESHLEVALTEYERTKGYETLAAARASRRVKLLQNLIDSLRQSVNRLGN